MQGHIYKRSKRSWTIVVDLPRGADGKRRQKDGRPLMPNSISHNFHRILEKAGLRRIRFHDLRHTTATLMLKAGVGMKVVQEILGHSSFDQTANTYSHVMSTMQDDAAEKYEALLNGKKRAA